MVQEVIGWATGIGDRGDLRAVTEGFVIFTGKKVEFPKIIDVCTVHPLYKNPNISKTFLQ